MTRRFLQTVLACAAGLAANALTIGPFFECHRDDSCAGRPDDFWALRPFYSQVHASETAAHDVLWPLVTRHRAQDRLWWRAFFLAYGDGRDGVESSWSFNLLPLFFCGEDRRAGSYWGLFPLYGRHPHFLLMDDWRFVLWPLWMDYDVKDIHHGAVLWPFVTWKESGTDTWGAWPLYSHARLRESDHWYALWPLVTWARYDEDRDTSGAGHSWMVWPLGGSVARARESQTLVLPPLFSYTHTPHVRRWRLPWPLVDVELGTKRDRVSVWPFYEQITGYPYRAAESAPPVPEERTRRYLWVIAEDTELETAETLETRFSIFPFFTRERRFVKEKDGAWRRVAAYTRVWPFWSAEEERGLVRQRALELVPIRHAEGLDRNWAPFWTFWTASGVEGGFTNHSLLWNIITWTNEND